MAKLWVPLIVVVGLLIPCNVYAESTESSTDLDASATIILTMAILAIILFLVGMVVVCCRRSGGDKEQEYLWHGKETDWKSI